MSIFDFLKRKKEVEKAKEKKRPEKEPTKKVEETFVKKEPVRTKTKKSGSFYYQTIKQPHISEKASYLAEKNQYTFKVLPSYNKKEIKNAVEGLYSVDVLSVKIVKIPAKKRRIGKTQGFKKGFKKAIVKIKEGQKIEIL